MSSQGAFRRACAALLAAIAIWGVLPVIPAAGQDQEVRLVGRVSWIAGETLVVSTDDSPSVRIDLSQADQSDYQSLAPGDFVVVIGIIPLEGDRVIAVSIKSLSR